MTANRKVLTIVVLGILSGCHRPLAPEEYGGTSFVAFEEFALVIGIPDERSKFRWDGVVKDLDEHMSKLLGEFGLTNATVSFANPSTSGRTTSWTDGHGNQWAISYILANSDDRISNALSTHEKYHALSRLHPSGTESVHVAVEHMGFDVEWTQYDEEFRATLIQAASLYAQGVPLENLGGSESFVRAVSILKAQRSRVDAPP